MSIDNFGFISSCVKVSSIPQARYQRERQTEEGEEALPLGSDMPFLKPSQIIKDLCTLNLKCLSLIFFLVFISFAYWEARAHCTHVEVRE